MIFFTTMNRLSQHELLHSLRAQLRHFDCSPDFGDAEAVAVIRHYLLLRIREAEGLSRIGVRPGSGMQFGVTFHSKAA
jgi:hypothetical protein